MSDHYILIGQTPVPVEPCDPYTPEGIAGLTEWARWFEDGDNRIVKQETVLGMCWVSTCFMGLAMNMMRTRERPLLFETMAFWGGEGGYEQERCSTWLEAEAMHAAMVRAVTRPKAVLAYLLRAWEGYWKEAKEEWLDLWREVAGIEPERSSDPLWQNVMDSMARWKEMRRKQRFT